MKQQFNALLIDDEPAARRLLKSLLHSFQNTITIIGEAGSGKEAISKINTLQPDVIFLDIQMPDMTGFEVLEQLQHQPNIIFTTAYEQFAMKAFESFSIDYLLKPIKEQRLEQSIEKLKTFGVLNNQIDTSGIREFIEQLQTAKKATALPIRSGDRINLVRFETISFLEARDKYVSIHTIDGKKMLTDQSLAALEEKLPDEFYRIQKSYIINKDRIKEMHRHFNSRYLFTMDDKDQTKITSGRTYHDQIKAEFGL